MPARRRAPLRPAIVAGLALWLMVPWLGPGSAHALALDCQRVPDLMHTFLQKHISFHYLDSELRKRAVDGYIERLDSAKTLFLAAEVDDLRARLAGIFLDLRGGDCSALVALNEDLRKRYQVMEDEVRAFVSRDDYALDTEIHLVLDADQRGHPTTPEERTQLIHRLVHFQMSNYLDNDVELEEAKQKLIHRYELINKRAKEREAQDVFVGFLDSFASSLDPHSNYMSAETVEDFTIQMQLSLEGIGVALSSRDGYSVVEKIIPGGATDRIDALEPQDKIIAVAQEDGEFEDVIDMDLRDVVRKIRGKRGTKVHLTVLRQLEGTERFNVTIVRDKIDLEEQAAKLRFETVEHGDEELKLALLDLPSFYGGRGPTDRQSAEDLKKLLKQVRDEKADGLLLDLSRNGGGLLESSVEIAGFFIGRGGVVAVKNAFSKVEVQEDPDHGIVYDGPLVVLTSRVSASASEIVAGALKDYRRAVIVGDDHTFGKGTVQSMVPLQTGLGAIKVTTALFFRPGGRSTQNGGVEADIVLPSLYATEDFGEKHQDHALPGQTIPPFLPESPTTTTGFLGSRKPLWKPVTPEVVTRLASGSRARVEASEEFSEIQQKLAEAEERKDIVKLADLIEERKQREQETSANGENDGENDGDSDGDSDEAGPDDGETKGESGGEEVAEEKLRPQQQEALQILADLVALQA